MSVPEENRPKTRKTQDTVTHPDKVREEREREEERDRAPEGTTFREAADEADVAPEDYEEGPGEERSR